jgi:predicted permease
VSATEGKEVSRSARNDALRRDVRHTLRMFRREPAFVVGVLLTFALTIGANATMFGLVDRLMLSAPSGIRAPEQVARVRLRMTFPDGERFAVSTTSYPSYNALASASNAFAGVAAARSDSATIGRSPALTQIPIVAATGNYFTVLGATPAAGRFFGAADDEAPAGNSVVVLGYDYWRRTFDGSREAIGRALLMNDRPFTIIGVAPRGFNGDGVAPIDAFIPLTAALRDRGDWMANRNLNLVSVIARLRAGVAPRAAEQVGGAALRDETSARGRSTSPTVELESVVPGKSARESTQGQIAVWLTAVSLIVLLIATANVGTLFALRAARRRRDLAVRVALGAERADLVRQVLVECVMLAVFGAAVGLVLSRWLSQILRAVLLPNVATNASFVDGRVLAASIALATLAGVGSGLAPLSQQRRASVATDLRSGGGQGFSGQFRVHHLLVGFQTALAMVLLVGAALFVRSLDRVQSQDLGFDTANLLYVTLDFRQHLPGDERDRIYYDAVGRARAVPGVVRATVAAGIPFGPHNIPPVSVPGVTWPPAHQLPIMYGATPDYLAAMGVRLISGRLINEHDVRGSPQVVLVNETMARTAWPGQSPLGKCVRAGFGSFPPDLEGDPSANAPCRDVVGVVRDSRARSLRPERDEDRLMQYYVPFEQIPPAPFPDAPTVMGLVVRTRGDVTTTAASVQRAIQSLTSRHVFAHVQPYQDLIDPQLRTWRLGATLFSALGLLALAIATAGLIGVVSYVVTQRSREIGVRLALGGSRGAVAGLVVRDAMRMSSIGIAIGAGAALAGGPLLAAMLFRTSPRDVPSLGAAAVVLLGTTVLAAAWPAWRAARVNPVIALRADG